MSIRVCRLKYSLTSLPFTIMFPVPGMFLNQWGPDPLGRDVAQVRDRYERALAAARRARDKSSPSGRAWADYWVGRLEFGVGYFDAIHAMRRAARAQKEGRGAESVQQAEAALKLLRQAVEDYARVAGDQSDRGSIAILAEYAYRPLQRKVAELRKGLK